MKKPEDDDEEIVLGDPYKIPYELLPLAPPASTKPPTMWELFLLSFERAPVFPPVSDAIFDRARRKA